MRRSGSVSHPACSPAARLLDRVGLPSSYLFAAMLLGLAIALTRPGRVDVVPLAFRSSRDYFAALEAKRA